MTFKQELNYHYNKSINYHREAVRDAAKLDMVLIEPEFKDKLLRAARNGDSVCVFSTGTPSLNMAYHMLAEEYGLKAEDSWIYTEGDTDSFKYRDVQVSGWETI